jgi:hypothetical protein
MVAVYLGAYRLLAIHTQNTDSVDEPATASDSRIDSRSGLKVWLRVV